MSNFFRIFYLLRYLFNNRKIKKLITIILLVFALIGVYDLLHQKGYCAEEITSSYYYDGVQATIDQYEALQNDFVIRILKAIKNYGSIPGSINNVLNRLSNGGFRSLFYYGDALGTYYQNTFPSAAQMNIIEVITMDASQISSNTYSWDWGLNGVQGVRGYLCNTQYMEFKINRAQQSEIYLSANTARHYLPYYLLDYKSNSLVMLLDSYLSGTLLENTDSLINSVENQTNVIQQQGETITNTINETNDFLNEDVSNSVDMSINVTPIEIENENTQGISTLVTYFTNKLTDIITNLDDSTADVILIPIPHSDKYIEFRSDMLSSWLKTDNFNIIYTLIIGGWWLAFGGACIIKIKRIYNWFQDGNAFEEGKFTSFMANLRKNNEFFDQFMM